MTIRYCPRLLAYHDHDRLTPEAVRSLLYIYGRGKGGFYCKHVLRRDVWAMKLLLWEIKAYLKVLFRRGEVRPVLTHLMGMAVGCCLRLGIEMKAAMRGTPGLRPSLESQ